MRKKLIRTLTFVFGLYFILEFLLPKEIGGKFDKSGMHSPSVYHDTSSGQYFLYYVGVYNRREQAVGTATGKEAADWQKYPKDPVLRPTLFNSADRFGFSSLSPIRIDNEYALFYLGHDMDTPPHLTVCWATSSDGLAWQKHGRLTFEGETPWRQQDEDELSVVRRRVRYSSLQSMTAALVEDVPTLLIAETNADGVTEVVRAVPAGTGSAWNVEPTPLPITGLKKTQKITSMSYVRKDGTTHLWMFLSDKSLCRASVGPEMPVERVLGPPAESAEESAESTGETGEAATATAEDGEAAAGPVEATAGTTNLFDKIHDMTVFAATDGYRLVYSYETGDKTSEDEIEPTLFYMISSPDGTNWPFPQTTAEQAKLTAMFRRGARAQPTYLSRGFEFMSTFLMVIGAFAIGLGGVNMGIMHGRRLVKGGRGSYNSGIFFVCLLVMFVAAMWGKPLMDKLKEAESTSITATDLKQKTDEVRSQYSPVRYVLARIYNFLFYNVQFNLGATLFSLVSFYMVGAAFRSFRAKSFEAGLLIIAATIVLLGQIPLGAQLGSWAPRASGKLLILFNAAAYRGVVLGMAVAAISTSVRLWLGLEKGMFHGT